MNGKIKKIFAAVSAAAIIAAMGTVFAAENETAAYGYLKGKANHYGTGGEQTFVYSQKTDTDDETENTADYSYRQGKAHRGGMDKAHYDSEDLVEAGIIDQATANAISEYAAKKHEDISAMYENTADMTPDERRAAFEERKAERKDGVDELVEAGVITAEQAEAIKNYKAEA